MEKLRVSCVWPLIEHIGGLQKVGQQSAVCAEKAYAPLFYHLGYIHSDMNLLRHGAQETVVNLLVVLKVCGRAQSIEISVEWDRILHVHAPSLRRILLSGRAGDQRTKGFRLESPKTPKPQLRQGTGYKVDVKTLKAIAPLLQHLLRLSFENRDYITCHQASVLLSNALGVKAGETWLDTEDGVSVEKEDALTLAGEIKGLMSGPCRGTAEGLLAGEVYVANQHRLSSSSVYHRVYRDVPQYAGRDNADGMCVGGEKWDKCITEERAILMLQEAGKTLSVRFFPAKCTELLLCWNLRLL
jgi:hypothetical protein